MIASPRERDGAGMTRLAGERLGQYDRGVAAEALRGHAFVRENER